MEFLGSHLYGMYDYGLGYFCKVSARPYLKDYDELMSKKCPEKLIYDENEKCYNLSDHFSKLVAKTVGYKSVKEYFADCTVTHRLKDIRVPTFFLNALDDPLYGPHVIPID